MSEHISKDCFWYSEDIDMGAIIPFCLKKSKYIERRDCYRCYEDYMARQKESEKTMLQERLDDMRHILQDLENQAKGDIKDDDQLSELRSTD